MKLFLAKDETMMKRLSEIKQKVLANRERIETCQDPQELESIKRALEQSAGVTITDSSIQLTPKTQQIVDLSLEEWRKVKEETLSYEQTIREYAMKIIEVVTDDGEVVERENKKANAKHYVNLRS